jgi:hypothetical protein
MILLWTIIVFLVMGVAAKPLTQALLSQIETMCKEGEEIGFSVSDMVKHAQEVANFGNYLEPWMWWVVGFILTPLLLFANVVLWFQIHHFVKKKRRIMKDSARLKIKLEELVQQVEKAKHERPR